MPGPPAVHPADNHHQDCLFLKDISCQNGQEEGSWYPTPFKRRSSWACIGNPNPEQETIKGTHAQETSAYQRRPTTQHTAQGSNPQIGALYMHLAKIPHTHETTPPASRAASTDQHGTHRGRNRYHLSAHKTKDEAPGQLPGAQKHG